MQEQTRRGGSRIGATVLDPVGSRRRWCPISRAVTTNGVFVLARSAFGEWPTRVRTPDGVRRCGAPMTSSVLTGLPLTGSPRGGTLGGAGLFAPGLGVALRAVPDCLRGSRSISSLRGWPHDGIETHAGNRCFSRGAGVLQVGNAVVAGPGGEGWTWRVPVGDSARVSSRRWFRVTRCRVGWVVWWSAGRWAWLLWRRRRRCRIGW